MSRVLSGVQPTGNLHLGNYLGAIKNWVDIQYQHESLFCIVDLHAITVPQNPVALREATLSTAAAYIACGINPEKSIIFHQSAVAAHAELAWLLGTITPLGWLMRMTQFKQKAKIKFSDGVNQEETQKILDQINKVIVNATFLPEDSNLGLFSYPVLMAADILIYHATHVPVGDDQKQHLELARDIAGAFNRQYKKQTPKPYFRLPEPMIIGNATRVMSLRDGTSKMSKSDESDYSRINLSDDADTIMQKIKKAKTDTEAEIYYDQEKRPEISNLINIFCAVTGENREKIIASYAKGGMANFKSELSDAIISHLAPITKKLTQLQKDQTYLQEILQQGASRARHIANENIATIKRIMGFLES